MTRTSRRFQRLFASIALAAAAAMCLSIATTQPPAAAPRPMQEAPPAAHGGLADSNLPPIRFQMLAGPTVATVVFTTPAAVEKLCARLGTPVLDGYATRGCTIRHERGTIMVLPNPCFAPGPYLSPSYVACHEVGHANGWPGTHGQ